MSDGGLDRQLVTSWAERIRPHLLGAVESIIAAGAELLEAKAALPHGQFGPLLDELGLHPRMAQRFMVVARRFANATHESHLPASVQTLELLARLDDDTLDTAIESGDVSPSTTRAEALALTRGEALDAFAGLGPDRQQLVIDVIASELARERFETLFADRFGFHLGDIDALRGFARTAQPGDVVEAWRILRSICGEPVR